jgi:hypothetical protein
MLTLVAFGAGLGPVKHSGMYVMNCYQNTSINQFYKVYPLKMMVLVFSHTKTAIFRPSKSQIKFQKTQKTCFVQNKNGHFWDIIFEPRF